MSGYVVGYGVERCNGAIAVIEVNIGGLHVCVVLAMALRLGREEQSMSIAVQDGCIKPEAPRANLTSCL